MNTQKQLDLLIEAFEGGVFGLRRVYERGWGRNGDGGTSDAKVDLPRRRDDSITADVSLLAERIERNDALLEEMTTNLALGFLGLSYELVKESREYDERLSQKPEVQFLRWCRNAALHGNRFAFEPGKPDKPARWDGYEISQYLQGQRLIPEFIEIGDAVCLVEDVRDLL